MANINYEISKMSNVVQRLTKAGAKRNTLLGNVVIELLDIVNEEILLICSQFYKRILMRFNQFGWKYHNDIYITLTDNVELIINFPDYLDYQDKGINGVNRSYNSKYSYTNKRPPFNVIARWAKTKGLTPNNGQSFNSMVYALVESIYKNGIKPKDFYGDLIDKLESDIINKLNNSRKYNNILEDKVLNIFTSKINK